MIRTVLLLALLVGCTAPHSVPAPSPVTDVPAALRTCPSGGKAPATPTQPRTVESLADGYNRVAIARETSQAALDVCAGKLRKLNRLYQSLQKIKTPR